MPLSEDAANDLLDSMLGSDHSTRFPATVYVALYVAGVEGFGGSATNYARVAITNNDTNWPDATGGEKFNANQINFPTPDGDTGNMDTYAIHAHITNDEPIIEAHTLESPIAALANQPVYIEAEALLVVIPLV